MDWRSERKRRRRSAAPSPYGFLRPPRRHEEDLQQLLERAEREPRLLRAHRASLLAQAIVVGALLAASIGLAVQSFVLMRRMRSPGLETIGWLLPAIVAAFALVILRRFLRIVSDYRRTRLG